METTDILKAIAEEMGEIQINDVIRAVCKGFERIDPQRELVCIAIPKYDKKQRRKILRSVYQMLKCEKF